MTAMNRRKPLLSGFVKNPGALFFLAVFLTVSPERVRAQEGGSGYYLEETGEEPRFFQRLSWESEEYASRYGVRVEKRGSDGWTGVFEELTGDNFIELSLPPGSYRCRVQAHDLLEKPAGDPGWIYFEVLPAPRPELESFSPKRVRLDDPPGGAVLTLTVRGRNLAEAAEFRLVPVYPAGPGRGGISPPGQGEAILPHRVIPEASGEGVILVFAGEQLSPGNYEIRVVNPGGLSDSLGTLGIYLPGKPAIFFVSTGYGPLIPLYGRLHELLEAPFFPAGAYGRIGFLPLRPGFADVGLEAAFHWTYIASRYEHKIQDYDVSSHFLGFTAYGLLRRPLNRNMALAFRLGGGIVSVLGFKKQTPEAGEVDALIPAAGGGLFFQWSFFKSLFAELGVEYTHFFSVDNPSPGYLRPVLGIGFSP